MVNSGKKSRRASNRKAEAYGDKHPTEFGFKPVKPLNSVQEEYLRCIRSNDVIFGLGPAGTGKTFVAASYAAEELYHRNINKIILTRPNVEAGDSLGFLPGNIEEKYAPYLEPFTTTFVKTLGTSFYEYEVKKKTIDPKPLGFMRGTTFENAVVLVDEAQNMTKKHFKMLLTRIGRNCKVILSGDPDQTDIMDSGLMDAVRRLEYLPGIEVIRFTDDNIVRSKMCKQIIIAYKD